jgi:DNA polymerase I-like protein with 3'-5' exonuclease and polymerase domains
MAIAYIDYEQQEFGIAAALSGDEAMMEAYRSGDPYLAFAKQARAVPEDATKSTHPNIREQFKVCILGVQYSMREWSLARSLSIPVARARELLQLHRETYPTFWCWSEAALNYAMLTNQIHSVFGWCLRVTEETNPRTLTNFPMQANGAEILRLSCCLMTESGIVVCAPVHDAVLIQAPLSQIDEVVADAKRAMRKASEVVLGGFPLRTEAKIFRYPEYYVDDRGREMWSRVVKILDELGVGYDGTGGLSRNGIVK